MIEDFLSLARVDFAPDHEQPRLARVVLATALSVVGSLLVDALLVVIGEAVFPATRGYVHFQFSDYAKLTAIGVVGACIGWPIATRISSAPRWLFQRLAVLVTLVLYLPDLYILAQGQPPKAVAVLMVMHLAIAVVTYNLLVRVAPVGRVRTDRPCRRPVTDVAQLLTVESPEWTHELPGRPPASQASSSQSSPHPGWRPTTGEAPEDSD